MSIIQMQSYKLMPHTTLQKDRRSVYGTTNYYSADVQLNPIFLFQIPRLKIEYGTDSVT